MTVTHTLGIPDLKLTQKGPLLLPIFSASERQSPRRLQSYVAIEMDIGISCKGARLELWRTNELR